MIRIGTAGWALPKAVAASFTGEGSSLARYAGRLGCVEINSSFYRPHRLSTYERWARETPDDFRFAAKLPKTVTHTARLVGAEQLVDAFLAEVAGLGAKLAVLLVQLPPSFAFVESDARAFFARLRDRSAATIVCEPRHATWFEPDADAALSAWRVARAAADPARVPQAAEPGGWRGPAGDGRGALLYSRWHGSPRMYWSGYEDAWLRERAAAVAHWPAEVERWCVFDNTGAGCALPNALTFASDVMRVQVAPSPARRAKATASPR